MIRAPGKAVSAFLSYALMIAAGVAIFFIIRHVGLRLTPGHPPALATITSPLETVKLELLLHILLALVVVIVAARLIGMMFRYLRQPRVMGEVVAGILLGPSLLGRIAPEASGFLLPPSVAPFLGILAQVGVILYMFLIGLELDTRLLRSNTQAVVAISHASILAPFLLGSILALWLYPKLATSNVPFTSFALFLGISMSVTAFPVLARILTDLGLQKSRIGVIAISCAAVDDVSAWCLLALVVSIVQAQLGGALVTILLTLLYVGSAIFILAPLMRRLAQRQEQSETLSQDATAFVFIALLISALITESIGIHALFGAFLLGALIPSDSKLAKTLTHRIEDLVLVIFLPAFFAFTGMRTQINLVSGFEEWLICGIIILVACLGKIGGSFSAGRLFGLSWRDAASVAVLMNTRGLMELIVLNIGLDLQIISPELFTMMVIMALVTTFSTTPALLLLRSRETKEES